MTPPAILAPPTHALWGRGQVARAVGVSYRQIDYWERSGLMNSTIPPLGSGSRALMDENCVKGVAILAVLMPLAGTYELSCRRPRLPAWDKVMEAVETGGCYLYEVRSGLFEPVTQPWVDVDCAIIVNVGRIVDRVEHRLAQMPPRRGILD